VPVTSIGITRPEHPLSARLNRTVETLGNPFVLGVDWQALFGRLEPGPVER
jgi:hypothetical protein